MLRIALLCCLLSLNLFAQADTEAYSRVDFQVEAAREVANDLLIVNLSVDIQDKQPAQVAQQLNTVLNDALKKSAAFTVVKTSSGNRNTSPVYGKNNQISAWRGHGQIYLESRDFRAVSELIMQLQGALQVAGLQFTIAPDTRLHIENMLINEAIAAFQGRAGDIRAAMGAKSYKIVHLSINAMPFANPMAMSAVRDAAPEFAGGESRITVQISGTIELQ
ncbi:MAG: SIMPL domain-containing protein [Gallionella sp.]|jgi:predicted secreted protein